jgi:hypothetical protein
LVIRPTVVSGNPRSAKAANSSSEAKRAPNHSRKYSPKVLLDGTDVAMACYPWDIMP